MPETRTVIRGGMIVDGRSDEPFIGDLAIADGVIVAVGDIESHDGDLVIDARGRYLLPGFIDPHSHADAAVFDPLVQRALLRQGVTTIIAGQDGVSYAPGNGSFATEYFAAINGPHPSYTGGGVAELLASYDETTPINVGYLVPAGTVRHEVMGYAPGAASPTEIAAMQALIVEGLNQGALGLSTGLDYVPGMHQGVDEITEMCRPVAKAGGIHVSHMRGGYEANARRGTDELTQVSLATGVRLHIAHYHGPSELLLGLVDEMIGKGIETSYDVYAYRRGCSLLAMVTLPPEVLSGDPDTVVATLTDPASFHSLLTEWFPLMVNNHHVGAQWAENLTLTHIAAEEFDWAHGLTVREAATRAELSAGEFTLRILIASRLEVGVTIRVADQRDYSELKKISTHPSHTVGSDGIYLGKNPHPRGWGAFAKVLRMLVREHGDYTWTEAARHLSSTAAARFGLHDRGLLLPGFAADIALVDPLSVSERATYSSPRLEAVGIDDVLVGGTLVLAGGELTGASSGRGLRRG